MSRYAVQTLRVDCRWIIVDDDRCIFHTLEEAQRYIVGLELWHGPRHRILDVTNNKVVEWTNHQAVARDCAVEDVMFEQVETMLRTLVATFAQAGLRDVADELAACPKVQDLRSVTAAHNAASHARDAAWRAYGINAVPELRKAIHCAHCARNAAHELLVECIDDDFRDEDERIRKRAEAKRTIDAMHNVLAKQAHKSNG